MISLMNLTVDMALEGKSYSTSSWW